MPFTWDEGPKSAAEELLDHDLLNFVGNVWGYGQPASAKEDMASQVAHIQLARRITRILLGPDRVVPLANTLFSSSGTTLSLQPFYASVAGFPVPVRPKAAGDLDVDHSALADGDVMTVLECWLATVGPSTASQSIPASETGVSDSANKPSAGSFYSFGNAGKLSAEPDTLAESRIQTHKRIQLQWRLRAVNGHDLSAVSAQGPAGSPQAVAFSSTDGLGPLFGSARATPPAAPGTWGAWDGRIYAIPLLRGTKGGGTLSYLPNVGSAAFDSLKDWPLGYYSLLEVLQNLLAFRNAIIYSPNANTPNPFTLRVDPEHHRYFSAVSEKNLVSLGPGQEYPAALFPVTVPSGRAAVLKRMGWNVSGYGTAPAYPVLRIAATGGGSYTTGEAGNAQELLPGTVLLQNNSPSPVSTFIVVNVRNGAGSGTLDSWLGLSFWLHIALE